MLSSRSLVQNLENTIALLPIQRSLQQAKITQAERDLANTTLTAPFNMRVTGLAIETHQFVSIGQTLLAGDSVERVEIIAHVAMADLRNLFVGQQPNLSANINTITNNLAELTGFKPVVKMDVGNGLMAEWEAEFVRISDSVDPQTRTMGIVVAVDRPMQKIIPGVRPPLSKRYVCAGFNRRAYTTTANSNPAFADPRWQGLYRQLRKSAGNSASQTPL